MNKEIYFCIDGNVEKYLQNDMAQVSTSYIATEQLLNWGTKIIVTNSMAHLSFDLIDLGYDIYLCYKDKKVKIEPHMDLSGIGEPCKDLRKGHNILKMFLAGVFDELLGIEKGE